MYKIIYKLVCYAYATILRELVDKAINDPDSEIDEFILSLLDKLFDYKKD